MGKDAAGVVFFQQRCRLFMAFSHDHPALFKFTAALFQGPGNIGQRLVGMGTQMRGKIGPIVLKRAFGPARAFDLSH